MTRPSPSPHENYFSAFCFFFSRFGFQKEREGPDSRLWRGYLVLQHTLYFCFLGFSVQVNIQGVQPPMLTCALTPGSSSNRLWFAACYSTGSPSQLGAAKQRFKVQNCYRSDKAPTTLVAYTLFPNTVVLKSSYSSLAIAPLNRE